MSPEFKIKIDTLKNIHREKKKMHKSIESMVSYA